MISEPSISMKRISMKPLIATVATVIGILCHVLGQQPIGNAIFAIVAIVATLPEIAEMARRFRQGQIGIDVLAVLAITTSLLLGEMLTAAVIAIMIVSGQALEKYAQKHAKAELTGLIERSPKTAHVRQGHQLRDVPVAEVRVGSEIVIKPGEVVPVDCRITEGASSFNEAAITGESLPVEHAVGHDLLSGSINSAGAVTAEATHTSATSQYQQIVRLVQEAASSRSPLVRLADRYSFGFTLLSLSIAGIAWAVSRNPITALEVLVVATPCPLLIATPVAIVSGMSQAARRGIIVKNGAALERLARIKTMAFDKTGTLTTGVPAISRLSAHGITEDELLAGAATLEQTSVHVLAEAVVQEAKRRGLTLPHASGLREDAGHGVRGVVDRRHYILGRPAYLEQAGVKLPPSLTADQTAAHLAIGGRYAGFISFADTVRPEAAATVAELGRLGVGHILMLTGDHSAVAQRIAAQVHITDVRAQCLPSDKVAALRGLPASDRPAGMVGDGVNDAPILAASDVGIALGAKGATAASESADIVIMEDNLAHVATALAVARWSVGIALQNGPSVILMLVAATGVIAPAALCCKLVDVAVIPRPQALKIASPLAMFRLDNIIKCFLYSYLCNL
jgi:heavy metal translocating P-type ATPase